MCYDDKMKCLHRDIIINQDLIVDLVRDENLEGL